MFIDCLRDAWKVPENIWIKTTSSCQASLRRKGVLFMSNVPVRERKIEKQLLNIKELCLYLGVGQTKASELIRGNNGFGVQIGNRWYANKKELDRWLEKNTA